MEIAKTIYDPKIKTWHGRKMPLIYHPNVSLAHVIINVLERNPNRIVQVSEDSEIEVNSNELKVRTIRAALHLMKLNLTNNDCIGIVAMNNQYLAPIILAALLIGVPIHPLDPLFDNADICYHFKLSQPKIIFCDNDMHERVKSSVNQIGLNSKLVTFDEKVDGIAFVKEYFEPVQDENDFVPIQIADGEKMIALIMCSSGTTGLSKAVCLSHSQITEKFSLLWQQTSDDVYLCFSSIYWITGILSILYGSLNCCKRIITKKRFTPELFFYIVRKYGVTQFLGPPSNVGLILQHPDIETTDLDSLKTILCGGSLVPEEYIIGIKRYFKNAGLFIGYGLSEICGMATINVIDNPKSVGFIVHNTQIRIVDNNDNKLGNNEVGEIVIKTYFTFLGYKGDSDYNNKVLHSREWVHTGDIGYFDENGLLFLVDRKKDIFKYRNFIISPSEIEQFIIKQKFIKSVCIVGIPDRVSGELPAAVIEKSDYFNLSIGNRKIEEIVYDLVKDNLADYKLLRGGVYVIDELPMTPSGKIIRRKVREIAIELYKQNKLGKTEF